MIQRIPGKIQSLTMDSDGSWLEFFICISNHIYDALVSMELLGESQEVLSPGINQVIYDECNSFFQSMKKAEPKETNILIGQAIQIILMLYKRHELRCLQGKQSAETDIIEQACKALSRPEYSQYSIRGLAEELIPRALRKLL